MERIRFFLSPAGVMIGIISLYRKVISPWLPPVCRFTPSCSEYGLEAIRRYGAVKGGLLTTWRLLRCQPFCRGGYDPVPELPSRRNGKNHKDDFA